MLNGLTMRTSEKKRVRLNQRGVFIYFFELHSGSVFGIRTKEGTACQNDKKVVVHTFLLRPQVIRAEICEPLIAAVLCSPQSAIPKSAIIKCPVNTRCNAHQNRPRSISI